MNKSVLNVLACFTFLLWGCNTDKGLNSSAAPDSLYTAVAGDYEGSVTCTNCPKDYLWYNLQLKKDGSFMLKKQADQTKPASKSIMGSWTMSSDSLLFLPVDSMDVDTFFFDGSMLRRKFGKGEAYKAAGTDFLKRTSRKKATISNNSSPYSGADFVAGDAGWSLEIDFQNEVEFTDSGKGVSFSAPASYGTVPNDLKAIIYRAADGDKTIVVTVFDTECTRNSHDPSYTSSVSVVFNNAGAVEEYRGCGNFFPDRQLASEWILKSINGDAVDSSGFMKGAPTISFNFSDNTVGGNDGCNSFFGPMQQKGNIIFFGDLAATLMHCPDMEKSSVILKSLSNQRVTYAITDNQLIITGPDNDELIYTKEN